MTEIPEYLLAGARKVIEQASVSQGTTFTNNSVSNIKPADPLPEWEVEIGWMRDDRALNNWTAEIQSPDFVFVVDGFLLIEHFGGKKTYFNVNNVIWFQIKQIGDKDNTDALT